MNQQIEQIREIKSMMEKSSRFISLSGWSGVAAGIAALIGAALAYPYVDLTERETIRGIYEQNNYTSALDYFFHPLTYIATGTFIAALAGAFTFTYIRSRKQKTNIWGSMARKVLFHFAVPFTAGSLVIISLILRGDYIYIAPLSLIIYGISLFSCAKYTVSETMYLGLVQIGLGLLNLLFSGYSYIFWTLGFGVFHILYGITMWLKYERNPTA